MLSVPVDPAPSEKEYGATPPDSENVTEALTIIVEAAGTIESAGLIVIVPFAVYPKLSVTRTVAVPVLAGAVYMPVEALMLPPPLTRL